MSFFGAQPIPSNNPPFGASAASYLVDNISFGGGSNFGSSIDISPASRSRGPFGSYTPPSSVSDKRGFNKTPDSVKLKFFANFERLLNSPDHSDLTLKCTEATFHAHQCILRLHTPFFAAATTKGFAEAETNTVSLSDHTAATVWRFLKWSHTGDYPPVLPQELSYPDDEGCEKHSKVYFLADYLGIDELKEAAVSKYEAHHTDGILSRDDVSREQFLRSVRDVFDHTVQQEDKLRTAVLRTAATYHRWLKVVPEYEKVLQEVDGFAAALAWSYFPG